MRIAFQKKSSTGYSHGLNVNKSQTLTAHGEWSH